MSTVTAARATWPKATAVVDGVEYRQARFVLREGTARLFDNNGNLLAVAEPVDVVLDRRTATVVLADGSTWNVEKAKGCGCGGG